MKTYFAWVHSDEEFNPDLHCREDEKIFHLDISHKEGGFAQARLIVKNPKRSLLSNFRKRYGMIIFEDKLIFRGRLIGMPVHIQGELIALQLTAAPENVEEQQKSLVHQIIEAGPYDKLFFKGGGNNLTLGKALQAQTSFPYWCRKTGKLSLSDLFEGRHHISIAGQHFHDSLQVNVLQDPLNEVEVEMYADWTQQLKGSCELADSIKRECRGGFLSTLTGQGLKYSWWKPQQRIDSTIYKVEESLLRKISSQKLPGSSKPIWHYEEEPRQIRFKRDWFDLKLKISWHYRQKRQEKAFFRLQQSVQDISGSGKKTKKLTFNLANILGHNHTWRSNHRYTRGFQVQHEGVIYQCQKTHKTRSKFNQKYWKSLDHYAHIENQSLRPTFFFTDRGHEAINYALEVAKSYLASSARCILVKFKVNLATFHCITLDHSVTIEDPRLPGEQVEGKVISYKFILDGLTGEKVALITLAVSVGTGKAISKETHEELDYVDSGFYKEDTCENASGIKFQLRQDQYPQVGLVKTGRLGERDIIREVKVINPAETQEQRLIQNQYPHSQNVKRVLENLPTDIQIKLLDLKTSECLTHELEVDVLTTWSAPQQIDLSASSEEKESLDVI